MTLTDFQIETCESLPPKEELSAILSAYYETIVQRMAAMGHVVPPEAPASAAAEFWDNASDYLPPLGCLLLARAGNGEVIGCAMMKRFDATTGEMKRMYVSPVARGAGLGRALVEQREAVAKSMGLIRVVADTLTSNVEMQRLYARLGFEKLEAPLETATYRDQPMLRPHLHFYAKDI